MRTHKNMLFLACWLLICGWLLLPAAPAMAQGPVGSLSGIVFDRSSGDPLIGATVRLMQGDSTLKGGMTDLEGKYTFRNLEPGLYRVKAQMISYGARTIDSLEVTAGDVTYQDIQLAEEGLELETVEISAKQITNTENSLLAVQSRSPITMDAISSDLISRSSDNNAAGALQRVTGVTIVDNRYVFVRGLGDRYSLTLLNGSRIPGLDPDRNAVQLDIFPSSIIQNIIVYKTFSPELPGSFSGGLVDIATKDFPENFTLQANASLSYNTQATFAENALGYEGGATDLLGYDDGTRAVPDNVEQAVRNDAYPATPTGSPAQQARLEEFGRSFNKEMHPSSISVPFNHKLSLSVGDQTELRDRPLGYFASLSYRRTYRHYDDGDLARYRLGVPGQENLDTLLDFNEIRSWNTVNWSALLFSSLDLKPNHRLSLNLLHTVSGQGEARYQEGPSQLIETSPTIPSVAQNRTLAYIHRSLSNVQLVGDHYWPERRGLRLNWRSSYALSIQDEPDLRFFVNLRELDVNNQNPGNDSLYIIDASNMSIPARFYRNLLQHNIDNRLELELPVGSLGARDVTLNVGGAFLYKTRRFEEFRFTYFEPGQSIWNDDLDAYLADSNFEITDLPPGQSPTMFVRNESELRNSYSASQYIGAGFASIELPLTEQLKAIVGARVEYTNIEIETDLFLEQPNRTDQRGELQTVDLLPSASLIYTLKQGMNLRLNYGRTLARPSFREIAPFESFNFFADFTVSGSADLQRSLIDNLDIRYEWFPRLGEILSVSGFFKYIQNPITQTFDVQGGASEADLSLTYTNIQDVLVAGAELDARKNLDFISPKLKNFKLGLNASYIYSRAEIPADEMLLRRVTNPEAKDTRQLPNQSPYIVNTYLMYNNDSTGTLVNLSFNVWGQRLSFITLGGAGDAFERPRPLLNLVVEQRFAENWTVRAAAKNLLNPATEIFQEYNGREYVLQSFTTGITFSLGVGARF